VLDNNIVWHNRSFFFKTVNGQASLCSSNKVSDASGNSCATLPEQSTTGQCTGNPAYWDLGVIGDVSVIPSLNKLSPTYSVITSGYTGSNNSNANPNLAHIYCNGSRITPEYAGIINPPSPKSLQVAATVDEGNNYVSLRYGPLTIVNPNSGALFGDYHFGSTATSANSSGIDHGKVGVSAHDIDNQIRPQGSAWDIGADEKKVPSPIASLSAASLAFGNTLVNTTSSSQTVTLTNSGDATLNISSIGITGSQFVTSNTCGASLAPNGTCNITVTFKPTSIGNKSDLLSIADNAVGSPQTVTLSGNGIQAAVVNFTWQGQGTVGNWGNVGGTRTISVTNTGPQGSQLSLSASPSVANLTGGSQFSITGGTCSNTTVLGTNNFNRSCTVIVTRARPTTGSRAGTGTLLISDTGALLSSQYLSLTGN
jgi:archaellum component FlaF (FlaF/FlaG flagellin family)